MKVKDLMENKIGKVREGTSIEKAIEIMYKKRVGSIIIVDNKKRCKGIFTNTDALRAIVKKVPLDSNIDKVMSKNVITILETASFSKAKALMNRFRIRRIPVMNTKGNLVGMLTIRSIVDEIIGIKK